MSNRQPSTDEPEPDPTKKHKPQDVDTATAQGSSTEAAMASPGSSAVRKEKSRVRFNSNADARNPFSSPSEEKHPSPERPAAPVSRPRPSVLRTSSGNIVTTGQNSDPEPQSEKANAAEAAAQARAKVVAENVRDGTTTAEERASLESTRTDTTCTTSDAGELLPSGIPLQPLDHNGQSHHQTYGEFHEKASDLVRSYTQRFGKNHQEEGESSSHAEQVKEESQQVTPAEVNDGSWDGVYGVERPENYRGGVLSHLLKLYNKPAETFSSRPTSLTFGSTTTLNEDLDDLNSAERGRSGKRISTGGRSGSATPNTKRKKWYEQNKSQETLATLIGASASLANPATPSIPKSKDDTSSPKKWKKHRRTSSANRLAALWNQEETRITSSIADVLCRQEYIVKLCKALMISGAPTHRLEEYCSSSADALGIEGSFLYMPGCMIISFDDSSTHTTEV